MSDSDQIRVFISYAHKDGADLAQRLQASLSGVGLDTWLDTQRLRGGSIWSAEIEHEVDARKVMIALLSPGSYTSEICRAEQLRALDKGNRVIPVLAVKGSDRPLYVYARQYRDFTNADDYNPRLAELLGDIGGDATATLPDHYRNTRVTYLTAPPQVFNYLERTEALRALRDTLFAESPRQPIALTALHGMGGIGKTVLAKALTDDPIVRRAFPDGIVWITAGKERQRDFIEEMREVGRALGDDLSNYDTSLGCQNRYRTTISEKAALIVVDNVWSKSDIEPLVAESRRSRFLFTTRNRSIANFVSAREHQVTLLDQKQARELLAAWANAPVEKMPASADDIVAQCGRLPLALSVVGAMLRDTNAQFWSDTLDLLRNADLSAIQDQLPEGQQTFFKTVEVSFQFLKPEMQEHYKALAVLPEDLSAPLSILQTLWNVRRAEAVRIAKLLVDRSLAQWDGGNGTPQNLLGNAAIKAIGTEGNSPNENRIRLHDLQHDWVRAQFPDRDALNLIHGALRLSSHVIKKDPEQFVSQLVARLLPFKNISAVKQFAEKIVNSAPTPWFRLTQPTLHPPATSLVRTLEGHTASVTKVWLSSDGRLALSASQDETLRVWDVESGRQLRILNVHNMVEGIKDVAVSEDRQLAVSASYSSLKVWDLETGRELRTLHGHTHHHVYGVALSGNGRIAVSASGDETLKVWDVETGQELRTLRGHSKSVGGVAVSRDGRIAVSASWDCTLKVWDLDKGRELRNLRGHTGAVYGVALSGDARLAVSASGDHTLKVWDLETSRELCTLRGHTSFVDAVALSRDKRCAVSASNDGTLRVWDLKTGFELRTFKAHASCVNSVALSADGRIALSGSWDKTIKVWNLEEGQELSALNDPAASDRIVAVSANVRRAVSVSGDGILTVWDVRTECVLRTLRGLTDDTFHKGVALSDDGRIAVSVSSENTLKVWDIETGRVLRVLQGHTKAVEKIALSTDGRRVVSGSDDGTLRVWDVETGFMLHTFEGLKHRVSVVAVSGDGRRVFGGSHDMPILHIEPRHPLRGHTRWSSGVGKRTRAIYPSHDYALKVWDVGTGFELRMLRAHTDSVLGVAASADGRVAVSASSDKTLKVWDVETGRVLWNLEGHTDSVFGVDVSADGQRAISASADRRLKAWDLETGVLVATFTFDAGVYHCAIIDNDYFIAGDVSGHVHFLHLEKPKQKN